MENKIKCAVNTKQNKIDVPFEKCIICGEETIYRFSTPINQRKFYIEGAGQICHHCYYEVYIRKTGD